MKCVRIFVYGKVQGVYFRKSAKDKALEIGIRGNVRNCADGSVMIEACGSENDVERFLNWCKNGPERARVERTEVHLISVKNFSSFAIIY
ncbi:MAG: acylphosphatase [Bacteroidia bacterium]|nr:acylphosphatase [Bacteroidia bacterium]MCZ2276469.1 acylphosphatase [Bacteroidia bacterium]